MNVDLVDPVHIKCYLSGWLQAVRDDCEEEGMGDSGRWSFALLPPAGRQFLWHMCRRINVGALNGVPAQACRLYERYTCFALRHALIEQQGFTEDDYEEFIMGQMSKSVLLMTMCIVLARKMQSSAAQLKTIDVQKFLQRVGFNYDKKTLLDTELEVFQILDYKIPLWSSTDVVGVLGHYIGMSQPMVVRAKCIINIAEVRRVQINARVLGVLENRDDDDWICYKPIVRTLHLCAGAVATCARVFQRRDVTKCLASIIREPSAYLGCLGDAIAHEIFS